MIWVGLTIVLAIHEEQIAEHGGASGVFDSGMLSSALDRPKNIAAHEPDGDRDLARLAAAYGHGIAKNHPFMDANKRTALVVTETFLNLNGLDLTTDDAACVAVMRAVADGTIRLEKFVSWIRENIALIKPPLKPRSGPEGGPLSQGAMSHGRTGSGRTGAFCEPAFPVWPLDQSQQAGQLRGGVANATEPPH